MKRIAIAVALMFGLPTAALAQDDWRVIDAPGFSVEMPGEPEYSADTDKTPDGPLVTHQYIVGNDHGKRIFIATTIVYPSPEIIRDQAKSLQIFADSMQEGMDSKKWTTVRSTEMRGRPALDTTGVREGSDVRSFMVVNDRQLVSLILIAPKGQMKAADAERFIESVKFK